MLKFKSNLVCAPCHHGKMINTSYSLVNTVMTEQPRQLLHMDVVSPSRICSMGDKRYALSISFALSMVLISSFLPRVCLNRIELWNKRTAL
jgi:hypothetical protein